MKGKKGKRKKKGKIKMKIKVVGENFQGEGSWWYSIIPTKILGAELRAGN
ncbi:hypothetical protein ACEF17_10970 [Streptococcus hyovaginalis]